MRTLIAICFFIVGSTIVAQQLQPVLRHFSTENGLPSSEIYQSFQDSKNFVWLATNNGVCRFDGTYFRNYKIENGLPDNAVLYIVGEDKNKVVWFLTMSLDLFGIDKNDNIIIHPQSAFLKNYYKSGANVFPAIGYDDCFYINMITDGSCIKINNDTKAFFLRRPPKTDNIILQKNASSFSSQLTKESSNTFKLLHKIVVTDKNFSEKIEIKGRFVYSQQHRFIYEKGKLFSYYKERIYILNKNSGTFDSVTFNSKINDLFLDKDSNLFVSTHQNGVYLYYHSNLKTKPLHFLSIKSIGRIRQDNEGGYWIPTLNNGMYYWASISHLSYVFKEEDQFFSTDKMVSNEYELLFTVANGKCCYVKGDSISYIDFHRKNSDKSLLFQSLYYDTVYKRFLVSTNDKSVIEVINGKATPNKINDAGAVLSYEYAKGKLYAGTWINIKELNPKSLKVNFTGIEDNKIRADALCTLTDDSILVGSVNGLNLFTPSTKSISTLSSINSYYKDKIRQIVKLDDYILMATKTNGILISKKNNLSIVDKVTTENGLCSNNIHQIALFNGELWIATDKGLNRYASLKTFLNKELPLRYIEADGLLSNTVYGSCVLNNQLYVNTQKGVSVTSLDYLRSLSNYTPNLKLEITDIKTDSIRYPISGNITIPDNYTYLTIKYSGIYFKDPSKLIYKYYLKGFDEEWNHTVNNHVDFTNLSPGEYEFHVMVSVDGGKNWRAESAISFYLKPKFYQTWWFRIPIILGGLLGLYRIFVVLFFKAKLKKLKRARAHIRMSNIELKALRSQMNPHFIFNVISSIQHYVIENDSKSAYKYLATFAKLMRNVLNSSDRKDILLKDELAWLNQYMELESMRFKDRFEYTLAVAENINIEAIQIPSMIIQPIIENAIKHGVGSIETKGKIDIIITKENNNLKIIITDNGLGINNIIRKNNKSEHQSMATKILKDRISIYNDIAGFEKLKVEIVDLSEFFSDRTGTRVTLNICY